MTLMTAMANPLPSHPPLADTAPPVAGIEIATPFGRLSVEAAGVLSITGGILGFEGCSRFALAPIPKPRLSRFMVLQSIDQPTLSFIVLPVAEGDLLAAADREEAAALLGCAPEDAAFLLMVTVRKEGDRSAMTVNLRAPIVLDTHRRIARQCVLSNNAYSVRHPL